MQETDKIHINDLIDSLQISSEQKEEFKALNFVFYNNYFDGQLKQPYFWKRSQDFKALHNSEKMKLTSIHFSFLGFLFGPFAYLIKGMFLKFFLAVMLYLLVTASLIIFSNNLGDYAREILVSTITSFLQVFWGITLKKDCFYEKCLKNKSIIAYIKMGRVVFTPKDITAAMTKVGQVSERLMRVTITLIIIGAAICSIAMPMYISSYNYFINKENSSPSQIEQDAEIEEITRLIGEAQSYEKAKDWSNTLQSAKKALSLIESSKKRLFYRDKCYMIIGRAYYNSSDYKNGIESFTQAITYNKNNSKGYFWRGCCYYNLGDKKAALMDFETYKQILINKNGGEADLQNVESWIEAARN